MDVDYENDPDFQPEEDSDVDDNVSKKNIDSSNF